MDWISTPLRPVFVNPVSVCINNSIFCQISGTGGGNFGPISGPDIRYPVYQDRIFCGQISGWFNNWSIILISCHFHFNKSKSGQIWSGVRWTHVYVRTWLDGRHILRVDHFDKNSSIKLAKFHLARCKQMPRSNQIVFNFTHRNLVPSNRVLE